VYGFGTLAGGVFGPLLFGRLIGSGSRTALFAGYWSAFLDHWTSVFQQQNGVVMGLEFDHPEGAKVVMRHLYQRGVWAIFSTLDPRVLQYKPGLLMTPELCEELLDRTEAGIAGAAAEMRRGAGTARGGRR